MRPTPSYGRSNERRRLAARIAAVTFCLFHPKTRWFFDVEARIDWTPN